MYKVRVRVRELCKERGWSINELSRRASVTYSTVRRYATQSMPKVDMDSVCRVKAAFNCSWDELLEIEGDDSLD